MFNKEVIVPKGRVKVNTSARTFITHEGQYNYNAPHEFLVHNAETGRMIQLVHFQEGPIKEAGVNGVTNEDLLHMVRLRLEGFQASEFKCEENQVALESIINAIEVLESRTKKREERGVEGTHVV